MLIFISLNLKNMLVKPKILSDNITISDSKLLDENWQVPTNIQILDMTKSCWPYCRSIQIKKEVL